jgi:hypothetical protein
MGGGIKNIGCALVIGWFVLIGTAKAGPPFVTDDPEVPPVGGWEINIPFTLNRTPGSTQMSAPSARHELRLAATSNRVRYTDSSFE